MNQNINTTAASASTQPVAGPVSNHITTIRREECHVQHVRSSLLQTGVGVIGHLDGLSDIHQCYVGRCIGSIDRVMV